MSVTRNPKDYIAPYEMADEWEEVLLGDKELFKEMTEPFIPALADVARRDIRREKANGNLLDALRPEELVGETLLEAWARRYNRTDRQSFKDWLLSIQSWVLQKIVWEEKEWKQLTAVSLESPAAPKFTDNDNDDWDWITPQTLTRNRWRDVIVDEHSLSHAI